ncbi:MAG: hypothetical protein JKY71_10545 [Alphaproteobacteria bacterium]|nr:hypothetical protein [Alphaproteobacteria bacterium]
MTEAQFPSGPRDITQALQNSSNQDTNARAVSLPEAIEAQAKVKRESIRLTGEVVRSNDDGSVTVRTDRGDIDLRPDNRQARPERGQQVEINIPTQKPNSRTEDIPVELRHAKAEQAAQRSTSTPVDVEVRPGTTSPPPQQPTQTPQTEAPPPKQGLPPEGSAVRLQPASAQSLANLPPAQPAEISASTLQQRVEFQSQIISLQANAQLQQELANAVKTAPPPPLDNAAPLLNLLTNLQSPQIVSLENVSAAIPQGLPQPFATFVSSITNILPLSTADKLGTQATNPQAFIESAALPPSVLRTPSPLTELTVTPLQEALEGFKLKTTPSPLDARITQISLPGITVSPPGAALEVQAAHITNSYMPQTQLPAAQILQNQPAPTLSGIVTNITGEQLPVISVVFPQISSDQIFTLQFPSENVSIGTQIQVTPIVTPDSALAGVAAGAQTIPLTAVLQPAAQWTALEEVLQTLTRNAPQVTQNILNITPSPSNPSQLSPAILFFVAAVRGGDMAQWLGDKAQNILKLQKGSKALNRISNESQMLGRVAGESFGNDWRAMNIPMYWQGDLQKVALYYKHERDNAGEEDEGKIKSTRFVFDLTLENMGQVQLDGLFRPHSDSGTRLDLVVRTEEIFSKATQAEMRRLYAQALRDTQVTGELSFQNQPDSWVTIKAKHHEGLSVQS